MILADSVGLEPHRQETCTQTVLPIRSNEIQCSGCDSISYLFPACLTNSAISLPRPNLTPAGGSYRGKSCASGSISLTGEFEEIRRLQHRRPITVCRATRLENRLARKITNRIGNSREREEREMDIRISQFNTCQPASDPSWSHRAQIQIESSLPSYDLKLRLPVAVGHCDFY